MTTTSRGLSRRLKHARASHTPGIEKGGFCVRPKDHGTATSGNPYKGAGLKGNRKAVYDRLWQRWYGANNIKKKEAE